MKLGTMKVSPIVAIILLGVICSVIYACRHVMVVDAGQLLERGFLFTQGELVPFGPRSSKTNFIWGSLVSVYTGIFLAIGGTKALLGGILLTQLAGLWLLTRAKFLNVSTPFFLLFAFLFWCSPWRSSEVFIWNPSLLLPLSCLWLYGLDRCYRGDNFLGTFLIGLSVAFTIQIHNSHLFLVILTLLLWARKQIKVDLRAAFLSIFVLLVMLIPTFIALKNNPAIMEMNQGKVSLFGNLFNFGEAVKGLLYWFRYPSFYFGATTFQLPKIIWASATLWEQAWFVIKWLVAVPSLVYVAYCNYRFFRHSRDTKLKTLCVCAIISLISVSALSPVPFNFWHLYLVYPFALIPIASITVERANLKPWLIGVTVYFLCYSWFSSIHSHKHRHDADLEGQYQRRIQQAERISEKFAPFSLKMW